MSQIHVAIIEWGSDSIDEPAVLLHGEEIGALRAVVTFLREHAGGLVAEAYADDQDFLRDHPYPPADADELEVRAWLLNMRAATTSPWVEVYVWLPLAGETEATNIPFQDVVADVHNPWECDECEATILGDHVGHTTACSLNPRNTVTPTPDTQEN